jgi:hypothetical protein
VAESSLLDSLAYYYAEVVENLEGAPTRGLACPFAIRAAAESGRIIAILPQQSPIGNA